MQRVQQGETPPRRRVAGSGRWRRGAAGRAGDTAGTGARVDRLGRASPIGHLVHGDAHDPRRGRVAHDGLGVALDAVLEHDGVVVVHGRCLAPDGRALGEPYGRFGHLGPAYGFVACKFVFGSSESVCLFLLRPKTNSLPAVLWSVLLSPALYEGPQSTPKQCCASAQRGCAREARVLKRGDSPHRMARGEPMEGAGTSGRKTTRTRNLKSRRLAPS